MTNSRHCSTGDMASVIVLQKPHIFKSHILSLRHKELAYYVLVTIHTQQWHVKDTFFLNKQIDHSSLCMFLWSQFYFVSREMKYLWEYGEGWLLKYPILVHDDKSRWLDPRSHICKLPGCLFLNHDWELLSCVLYQQLNQYSRIFLLLFA